MHPLRVKAINRETPEACSVIFDIPAALKATFAFKAGQYLTLETEIGGEQVRRAYSISTAPSEEDLAVTVKEVHGGKMSTYINTMLKVGDTIQVMPPEGNFVVEPDHDTRRYHVLMAAGSGITPILSMIKTILEEEPMSECHLLYGNRNENTIIFKDQLDHLSTKYKGQLHTTHVLSKPVLHRQKGLGGFFKAPLPQWKGATGRITTDRLEEYLKENGIPRQKAHYYICGPGNMIQQLDDHLSQSIEQKAQIHVEYFSAPVTDGAGATTPGAGTVHVTLKGQSHVIEVPASKAILDVLIDLGVDPPYSCSSGACSTCMAKVSKGKVSMDACFALDDDEIEDGYVLTCQAHPQTDEVHLSFDE
jgi:ring-1,2-phenylacetyl-CoA epoxidase subunit PaaE